MKTNNKKNILEKWKSNQQMFINAKNKNYCKPSDDIAISIQHLTMIFKTGFQKYKKAVDDLSFNVKKGQFHGFIGNNGSGKTTTIRSILGFYPSYIGKIYIDGIESRDHKCKNKIGYIPEVAIFPKNLSVKEYLYCFGEMSNIAKQEIKPRIDALIDKYGFNIPDINKSPAFMSSGQKKSVLLIQALLNDPDILIMDEPAANLDPTARIIFFDNIKKLQKEGKTILISSHILDELEKYIDSFTVLQDGKLLDSGMIKDKVVNYEMNTKLIINNSVLIEPYMKSNNIKYKLTPEAIYCNLENNEIKIKLIEEISNLNLEIISLQPNVYSLSKIYFDKS
ncbi:ABC transporter ATP-binding protein [Mycoplasmopsis primatum]|uniref:ABC transporter ATP-binding protein n=1 Tax=Mycoplasmopsis primatum TaxID=55604 RepID=UPI0004950C89|nr:ABC transporter ATP-binding protein [Mycoplasmopsis primatum]